MRTSETIDILHPGCSVGGKQVCPLDASYNETPANQEFKKSLRAVVDRKVKNTAAINNSRHLYHLIGSAGSRESSVNELMNYCLGSPIHFHKYRLSFINLFSVNINVPIILTLL